MKRRRRRSLTKTRKWSMCRAGVGGPQATACAWVVTTGRETVQESLGPVTRWVSAVLGEHLSPWRNLGWPGPLYLSRDPARALPVWGTYRLSPCLDGTRLGGRWHLLPRYFHSRRPLEHLGIMAGGWSPAQLAPTFALL